MNPEHKIRWGLIAGLVLLHAFLGALFLGAVVALSHSAVSTPVKVDTCECSCCENCNCVDCKCPKPLLKPKAKFEDSKEYDASLPIVDESARAQVKQGKWVYNANTGEHIWCPTCPADKPTILPNVIDHRPPRILPQPVRPVQPAPQPQPVPSQPANKPSSIQPGDKPAAPAQRYQITLFLIPGNKVSDTIESWFDSNPTLVEWRNKCTFQKFTPDNKLYQTLISSTGVKLSDTVPVSMFPAVVFADPKGAHIHAAGKGFLPDTPEQLIADVQLGREHYGQVKQDSGRLVTSQYSWDDDISPKLKLSPEDYDCGPDGCKPKKPAVNPTEDNDQWYLGKKLEDVFKKKKEGVVKDALWGWWEITITGVVLVVLIVLGLPAMIILAIIAYFAIRAWRNRQQ